MLNRIFLFFLVFCFFYSCETTENYIKKNIDEQEKAIETTKETGEKIDLTDETAIKYDTKKLDSDTIAIIGKYVLTKEKYKVITDYMKEKFNYTLTSEQEKEFIEYLVNKKLLAIEARKSGYAEKKDIQIKYEWDFDDIISHEFYNDYVEKKSKVTDAEAKNYYEKNKSDFVEVKAQHILIKNKNTANNLYQRIKKGESFDDIAKNYSEDETTKSSAGDLGYFTKGMMVKEFEDTAFSLSAGEVSEPVKTIYGYHIIKVNDKRKISFDDSKDRIIKMMREKKKKENFENLINKIKSENQVIINEKYIK